MVAHDLLVWDPLTGEERRLPRLSPPLSVIGATGLTFNAAVLCAASAEGCDHSDCQGRPFSVVVLLAGSYNTGYITTGRVYSSETGNWRETTSSHQYPSLLFDVSPGPSALVGDTLYFRVDMKRVFKYQLGTHCLSLINEPPPSVFVGASICLTSIEDGGLGFTGVEGEQKKMFAYGCARGRKVQAVLDNGH